jgi:hypothetical protein
MTSFEKGVFFSSKFDYNLITQQQQQQCNRIECCFNIARAFVLSIIYAQKVAPIHTYTKKAREAQHKVDF